MQWKYTDTVRPMFCSVFMCRLTIGVCKCFNMSLCITKYFATPFYSIKNLGKKEQQSFIVFKLIMTAHWYKFRSYATRTTVWVFTGFTFACIKFKFDYLAEPRFFLQSPKGRHYWHFSDEDKSSIQREKHVFYVWWCFFSGEFLELLLQHV